MNANFSVSAKSIATSELDSLNAANGQKKASNLEGSIFNAALIDQRNQTNRSPQENKLPRISSDNPIVIIIPPIEALTTQTHAIVASDISSTQQVIPVPKVGKRSAGRNPQTYEAARISAEFLKKFLPKDASEEEWIWLAPLAKANKITLQGRNCLKRILAHVMKCSAWNEEVNREAKNLLVDLVKPRFGIDKVKHNIMCEKCRPLVKGPGPLPPLDTIRAKFTNSLDISALFERKRRELNDAHKALSQQITQQDSKRQERIESVGQQKTVQAISLEKIKRTFDCPLCLTYVVSFTTQNYLNLHIILRHPQFQVVKK